MADDGNLISVAEVESISAVMASNRTNAQLNFEYILGMP